MSEDDINSLASVIYMDWFKLIESKKKPTLSLHEQPHDETKTITWKDEDNNTSTTTVIENRRKVKTRRIAISSLDNNKIPVKELENLNIK